METHAVKSTLAFAAVAGVVAIVSLGGALSWSGAAHAQPLLARPSIVPVAWELDFTHDRPRTFLAEHGDGSVGWYLYVTYKVTNRSGGVRVFVPEMILATELGHIRRAGECVSARVTEQIIRHVGNPMLENPNRVVGHIFEGEEHARESVAVWPMPDPEVTHTRLFFGGLSGETQVVRDPVTGDSVLTDKVLMVTYRLPGQPATPHRRPFVELERRWVMR